MEQKMTKCKNCRHELFEGRHSDSPLRIRGMSCIHADYCGSMFSMMDIGGM